MDRYTSIKVIGDRLMRNPNFKNINFEALVDYTMDFFRIIGAPKLYIEKTIIITISEYKAELPCDLVEIIQVQKVNSIINNCKVGDFTPMKYATSSFRSIYHCTNSPDIKCNSSVTYSVENGNIYTSFCEGMIQLAYRGIQIDEKGYPMIPDNPRILRALENYIKVQYYTILFENMLIPIQILENVKQDYSWSVGAAASELNKIDDSTAETIRNIYNRLLLDVRQYNKGFKSLGEEEIFLKQP